jgi:hypothetical protein
MLLASLEVFSPQRRKERNVFSYELSESKDMAYPPQKIVISEEGQ